MKPLFQFSEDVLALASELERDELSEQAKYTPGPWWVKYTTQGFTVWANCGPTSSIRVAACGHVETFDQANAHLIAAAPELLEACEVAPAQGLDETDEHFLVRYRMWYGSFRRAAIAKAKDEK